ncbi:MAG TPA: methyltransferase domain-containing protein [Thermomicrobiales bacterium]|nr:methyltransferase domain-containing protein [Thermomicrobiales bacterium]
MDSSVAAFYDDLADHYHLIYPDWRAAVARHGQLLDALLRAEGLAPPARVLDCSCGIGTQAIGLALRGYRVHATDLSPAAVARAAAEARGFGVALTTGVADFRALAAEVPGEFDAVLSCDNAVPHLPTDADLLAAARNMRAKLRPSGLLLISIRDYDALGAERPRSFAPRVFDGTDGRRIVFQVWDWDAAGGAYVVNHFIVREAGGRWETLHTATRYRALRRDDLAAALRAAGFADLRWHFPANGAYVQPLVTARAR